MQEIKLIVTDLDGTFLSHSENTTINFYDRRAKDNRLAERDSNHISFNGAKFAKSALNSLIIRQVLSRSFALIFLNLSPLKCEAP